MAGEHGRWYTPSQSVALEGHLPADVDPAPVPDPRAGDVEQHAVGDTDHPGAPSDEDGTEQAAPDVPGAEHPAGTPPRAHRLRPRPTTDPSVDAGDTETGPATGDHSGAGDHSRGNALAPHDDHGSTSIDSSADPAAGTRCHPHSHPRPDRHRVRSDDDVVHLGRRDRRRATDGGGRDRR
ncbi:hypothetical protein [Streptomyces sp. 2231.1]|uniref:hypothetical protein n=1 Tax=Streptomyces sp. 2231.1 TaxID=1855347 RepID=UPI000B80DA95|nr:hypothetical protein [Streptomyces sp. 2231.1]